MVLVVFSILCCLLLLQNASMKLFSSKAGAFYGDFCFSDIVSFAVGVCQVEFQCTQNLPG